ncbi:MAG TPA: hypothetical protein VJT72_08820, partial [Pseudonocardiaceae bacterium]|nr:hypothetical protein [Pseudonocardiaceae bacterium]
AGSPVQDGKVVIDLDATLVTAHSEEAATRNWKKTFGFRPLLAYADHGTGGAGGASRHTRTRLILCGGALTVMRDLLGGGAPPCGRAPLELVLQPFWYREAASFWHLTDDPELAFRVHALLGGTPAYRAMAFGLPSSRESFDRWVTQRLLNPASAIFREGSLLLRGGSGVTDPTPYHGVLAAIAAGAARRSEIAGRIGGPATAIAHLLAGLQQVGLVTRFEDAFRDRRGIYRLTDTLIRLHRLVIGPNERLLVRGRAT